MAGLDKLKVSELQDYLKRRNITYSNYKKEDLVALVGACMHLNLPLDPSFETVNSDESLKAKLSKLGVDNPASMNNSLFTNDLSDSPIFGLYDIFNYLLYSRADYDRRKLKAYKSADDYRLFQDGHVEKLEYYQNGDHRLCVYRGEVKPTQKSKTNENLTTYSCWLLMSKEYGQVEVANCACTGGADGGCRHVGAFLYEIEAHMEKIKSCTDVPMPWTKKSRQSDAPSEIKNLVIIKAAYASTSQQNADEPMDLRHPEDRQPPSDQQLKDLALSLHEIDESTCCVHTLHHPDDPDFQQTTEDVDISPFLISTRVPQFVQSILSSAPSNTTFSSEELYNRFVEEKSYTECDIDAIQTCTAGQNKSSYWSNIRRGLMTASNAHRICSKVNSIRAGQNANVGSLLTQLTGPVQDLSHIQSINWGVKQEPKVRDVYRHIELKRHKGLRVTERGLQVSDDNPFLACSPDGLVTCKCKNHVNILRGYKWLVEIKCPFSCRDKLPQEAAIDKCGAVFQDNEWSLMSTHPYYYQIQMQLGILKLSYCDLVVHTKRGNHIIGVPFKESHFNDIIDKLNYFGKYVLFPHMLQSSLSSL